MKKYSPEVKEFIKANVSGVTTKDLVEMVNFKFGTDFTESSMKSYKSNHKLRSGTACGRPEGFCSDVFPQDVVNFIKENYRGTGHITMAELLNAKFGTAYTKAQIKGFYANHKMNSGLTGYFKVGQPPPNKGKKGVYSTGCEKGWFVKGHTPKNQQPLGAEIIDSYGYVKVKMAEPNAWEFKHRLVWQNANGAIPSGMKVVFLDGDKLNCALENLQLISNEVHLEMNRSKLRSSNADATATGILIAKLSLATSKKKKQKSKASEKMA